MDPRQTRLLVILGAILLVLVTVIFLEPESDTENTPAVSGQEVSRVERLRLETEEGELLAHRTPEGWVITAPFESRGNDEALDDLVAAVGRIGAGEVIDAADPADFGLGEPRVTLTLEGDATTVVEVGAEAPVDGLTYVRLGDGAIRAVEGRQSSLLGPPFLLLRDRHVLHIAESAVTALEFSLDGEDWRIVQGDEGWEDAEGNTVKNAIVQGALAALAGIVFDGIFEDLDPVEAGLAPPRGSIVLTHEGETQSLEVGGEKAGGVLLRNGEGLVGTVPEIESLFPTVEQLSVTPGD